MLDKSSTSMSQVGLAVVSLYAVLWLSRAIYRLYLHPLSRYPGSPVAAVSTAWYEWYWNYYQNGQMIFEIARLHRIHGSSPQTQTRPKLTVQDPSSASASTTCTSPTPQSTRI
jgi:hypothetical protein